MMSRRGLTLVELTLTIALLGLIGIPTSLLLTEHLHGALRGRDSVLATQLARRELERLDSFNDFAHPDLAVTTVTISNYAGYAGYTMRRVVSCKAGDCIVSPTAPALKEIEVTILREDSSTPLARMTTFRARDVLFGN